VISSERWRDNARIVGPPEAVRVRVPWRALLPGSAAAATVRELPLGAAVILAASAPAASLRSRVFAARTGLSVEREYLAFPTAAAPAYLVESAAPSVRLFLRSILASPPGTSLRLPIHLLLAVLRTLGAWRVIGACAPGRVAFGRRT
jgi:hypothetical protein